MLCQEASNMIDIASRRVGIGLLVYLLGIGIVELDEPRSEKFWEGRRDGRDWPR